MRRRAFHGRMLVTTETLISPSSSLEDYFRSRVDAVVERHRIDGDEDTRWYLVRLLCDYSHGRRFHDAEHAESTIVPLATYYARACEASSDAERRQHLRRLGDVALFVSSLFSGALARRPVDVDYYVAMGGSAYASLAEGAPSSTRERALADIFAALAARFGDYVAALSDIPERRDPERTLLGEIAEWELTRHPALARRLRERGVFLPVEGNEAPRH